MDVIMDFITDKLTEGILQKVVATILLAFFGFLIHLIHKLFNLRKDMEKLKSTIDKDKEQISRDKNHVRDYMDITERYKNETQNAAKQIEAMVTQERDAIMKIAIATDSQRSITQDRETLLGLGAVAESKISEDVNAQIRQEYLESLK